MVYRDGMPVGSMKGGRTRNVAMLVMLPEAFLYWSSLRRTGHVRWTRDDHRAAMMLYLACE